MAEVINTTLFNKKNTNKPVGNTHNIFIKGKSIIDRLNNNVFGIIPNNRTTIARRQTDNLIGENDVYTHLDGTYSKVDYVPGLKTTLYAHQQTAVKAMLDLEFKRSFTQNKVCSSTISYKIAYNVGVLSEPVGSGKTIDILAIICLSKIPRAVPDIMELKTFHSLTTVGYVRCKFKKFITPTIIFVGSSVMKQWEYAIQSFTDLKTYCIKSVVELKTLLIMISNKTVKYYDIILVKNGNITVPIELPNGIKLEAKNKVKNPSIYNIIANLRQYCWARVVVDDFDTIRLPPNAGIVKGIFTWYISSTRKRMSYRANNNGNYQLASEWLSHHDYGCANIMNNHFLFSRLNVRNSLEYIKSTTLMPCPKYHVAIFKNPHDRFISLLTSMGIDEVNRITEMLNGDALGMAAEAVGIKSTSVADIFSRILGNKFEQYKFAGAVIDFIEYQQDKEDERLPISQNPDSEDRYGKHDLLDFREIEYTYAGVKKMLTNTSEEYTEVKIGSGLAIQRVKDNIKHGVCPVCRMDLSESTEVIIVKCCNAVFCGTCGIAAQKLNDRHNKLQQGVCSNCRASLNIKDLLYIGDDLNLEDIEKENFSDDDDDDDEDEDDDDDELNKLKKVEDKTRTKYTAMIDIIQGEPVSEDIRVDLHIPNMLKGANYLPEAPYRKVLIFANFDETLKSVIDELEKSNIHHWRLRGGINEISKTSIAFTEYLGTCALVINSTKHCSGLNLQAATDLIFAHRMIDQSVESQVAGRGHRLGRTSPLNIWYMLYDNEYNELQNTHSVRKLTKNELIHECNMADGTEKAVASNV
jgi:hypothetical protein